jgi:hypothetical protein
VKNLLAIIICFFCADACLAQKVVQKRNNIIDDIDEYYQAIADSTGKVIQSGSYLSYRGKKTMASGQYKDGKRVGIWHYYDHEGDEMQQYDHDNNKLLFEAPQSRESNIRYMIDETINDKDKATPAVKIGGRYFGYLQYLKMIRRIHALRGLDESGCTAVLTLLVSPMGRLADCSVDLMCRGSDPVHFVVDTDAIPESEKLFIPATFNGQGVASRVTIQCRADRNGEVDIY